MSSKVAEFWWVGNKGSSRASRTDADEARIVFKTLAAEYLSFDNIPKWLSFDFNKHDSSDKYVVCRIANFAFLHLIIVFFVVGWSDVVPMLMATEFAKYCVHWMKLTWNQSTKSPQRLRMRLNPIMIVRFTFRTIYLGSTYIRCKYNHAHTISVR